MRDEGKYRKEVIGVNLENNNQHGGVGGVRALVLLSPRN